MEDTHSIRLDLRLEIFMTKLNGHLVLIHDNGLDLGKVRKYGAQMPTTTKGPIEITKGLFVSENREGLENVRDHHGIMFRGKLDFREVGKRNAGGGVEV